MRAGLSSAVTGLAARSVELSPRSIAGCECAAWRLESRRIRERCRRGTPRGGWSGRTHQSNKIGMRILVAEFVRSHGPRRSP
jgi:hypothetical protein